MSLKAVVVISFCLLSLALASGEVQINQNGSTDLEISHENLLKSILEKISGEFLDYDLEKSSKLIASLANRATPRVTIEGSNLNPLEQVAAADCLKLAYEYHDSDADRIELFLALLSNVIPTYEWNAVLDYQHLYYIGNYYIRLRTDSGDLLFAFSSKK